MVQILPLPEGYPRQIDMATTWYLWKGATFRVPLSTIQRRKLRSGWNLTNVSTKSRALLYYRLTIQGRETDTLTANWLRKWDLLSLGENPPHITRIPHYLGDLRQYALDNAYIHTQGCGETNKAYKSRIYSTMSHLLNVTVVPPLMRNEMLWPNTDWPMVWKNIQATPTPDTLRSQWYNIIHDLTQTNERLHKTHLSPTDQCRLCNQMDTLSHRLTNCGEGRMMWFWTRLRIAAILRLDKRNIPEDWLIRPDFRIWPPKRNCAVLWFPTHLAVYRTKQDRSLTMNDYLNFMGRSKWKLDARSNRTSLVGNYLQILGT
jgi:hypothetical protein